ncbi:extensin family protein [Dichotomicrobium thermohalophilum]|uniref:extensin-like domain-containing protein n=1 Tax=Dichotomicrobium thermohalophilum TaxID=933063 RepID=UPI0011C21D8C|nr:extensin family protein [Dichotomicrobium thermohalophilum]
MSRLLLILFLGLCAAGTTKAERMPDLPAKRQPPAAWAKPAITDGPTQWSPEEIVGAQRACIAVVARGAYDLEPLEPIRKGRCGAPAPVRLRALPGEAGLQLVPAATLTCGMAARFREWVDRVLQPTARARLGSPVAKIRLMGTYSCRRRYNSPDTRISQHARAKALDIAAFQTADGQVITVLAHWPGDDERSAFLREIHTGACQIFDTVLGPRANEAHANHFHFDIGSGGVCE